MKKLPIQIDLPDHFLDEEIRDGYLVTHEMKKLWAVEIDILFQIKQICDRHNIKWVADGGTLLGAARHKGFIPWDDDIDIDMLREDYDKFIHYAKEELRYPYFLQTTGTDPHSMYGHVKVRNSMTTAMQEEEVGKNYRYNQGVFVDIFPMDYIPDDIDVAKKVVSEAIMHFCNARDLLYSSQYKWRLPVRKNLFRLVHSYIQLYKTKVKYFQKGSDLWMKEYRKFEDIIKHYGTQASNHVYIYPLGSIEWVNSLYWDASFFNGKLTSLPFEWFELPVVEQYADFLSVVFGDWKKFVKGGSIHGSLFFDTEKPYNEYIK